MTVFAVLIVIAFTVALVWADVAASPAMRGLKMVASTGFIAIAISADALSTSYGRIVLVALALSWIGDLLLTFDSRRMFVGGLVAFLLGHIAYAIAFVTIDGEPTTLVVAAVIVTIISGVVWRRLSPHVADMKVPVGAYIVVISVMVILALGTIGEDTVWLIPMGASLFYVSDLFVARNRFVAPGSINRIVGLPLYYGAQVLLALSVSARV